ncbi:hypothetical protein EVJ58_g2057 [Rhodofomes roseus]|uniref:F-box domain-containing protein n=1 Tax=Rhodofomes roseus TaxID=34475 RepID=A0A4Y9YRX4_9APHY|nr:hypothetical protein EVJ58_g2057 [Rhodofomes roseus]
MSYPRVPLDVVDEIFQQLSPYAYTGDRIPDVEFTESCLAKKALAQCARACQAFQIPALKVLWREQDLTKACGAVLRNFTLARVKGPRDDANDDGDTRGEDGDEDWLGVSDLDGHNLTYEYLPGPVSPEEWSRFKYYAQFIRVLRHFMLDKIDSSVFFHLHQHTHGEPLFPNLHEVEWDQASPDLVSVISPTIRILRLQQVPENCDDEDNYGRLGEVGYRTRRHAFKLLLPGILRRMPDLQELHLGYLGHEGFWFQFAPFPHCRFVAPNLRILHISESPRVLMNSVLPAIFTCRALQELDIRCPVWVAGAPYNANLPKSSRPSLSIFAALRRLRIEGSMEAIATLVDAIVAPELDDIELICWRKETSIPPPPTPPQTVKALAVTLGVLCDRNAGSLRRFVLHLHSFDIPGLPGPLHLRHPNATASARPFFPFISPLLHCRLLEEVDIDIWTNGDRAVNVPVPTMLAAWPMLRTLSLRPALLFPDTLRAVARTSPQLKTLTMRCLSEDFLQLLAAQDARQPDDPRHHAPCNVAGNVLEMLCLADPFTRIEPDDIRIVAFFLSKLFPRLQVYAIHPSMRSHESWLQVLKEVKRFQAEHRADSESLMNVSQTDAAQVLSQTQARNSDIKSTV